MIDPQNIVRYDYTDNELQELIVFCVCVAGKKASVIAPRVDKLCRSESEFFSPFQIIMLVELFSKQKLQNYMKQLHKTITSKLLKENYIIMK